MMFNKIGACFNQIQMPVTNIIKQRSGCNKEESDEPLTGNMKHPVKHMEDMFSLIKRLMDTNLCQSLDDIAEESASSANPYKSCTEAINFIATSMLRELLQTSCSELSPAFVKEIQVYIKQLFLSGQNDLQSREMDKDKEKQPLNKFKLMVLTNAVCVDILVWATKDENGEL